MVFFNSIMLTLFLPILEVIFKLMLVYVDEPIVAGNDSAALQDFETY